MGTSKSGIVLSAYIIGVCLYIPAILYAESKMPIEIQSAAESGDAGSQYKLGKIYYEGNGVDRDYTKASHWFREAADQGLAEAQFSLYCAYYEGSGVDKSYDEALKWLRKAAEQGNVGAQNSLGFNLFDE